MKRAILLSFAILFIVCPKTWAQTFIQLSAQFPSPQPQYLSEANFTNLPNISVFNSTNQVYNFKISYQIYGDDVLLATNDLSLSPLFVVNPNSTLDSINIFDAFYNSMISYNGYKESLLQGIVPIHQYQIILTAVDPTAENNLSEPESAQYSIQTYQVPGGLLPANGILLSNQTQNVTLSWNGFQPFVVGQLAYYHVNVYPIFSGQTASQAVANNNPVASIDSIIDTSIVWQPFIDTIIADTTYALNANSAFAWQVQSFYMSGVPIGGTNGKSGISLINFSNIALPPVTTNNAFDPVKATALAQLLGIDNDEISGYVANAQAIFNNPGNGSAGQYKTGKTSSCDNGGFEDGNTNNWQGALGERVGNQLTMTSNTFDAQGPNSRHEIISKTSSPQYDPYVGGTILPRARPGGGNYSLRLGSDHAASSNGLEISKAQQAIYDVVIDNSNINFTFYYAFVSASLAGIQAAACDLEPTSNRPFFSYQFFIQDPNHPGQWIPANAITPNPIEDFAIFPSGVCGFTYNSSGAEICNYRNWTCVATNLSAYNGQTVRIVFTTCDCSGSQHFGYAYIDGLCESVSPTAYFTVPTNLCFNDDIFADASSSTNFETWSWEVQQCDASGNTGNWPSTDWKRYYDADGMGNSIINPSGMNPSIDIKDAYGFLYGWQCGAYYKITLATYNDCSTIPATHSQIIYIEPCSVVSAGPDHYVCYNYVNYVTLGTSSGTDPTGTTYSWSNGNNVVSTSVTATVHPSSTTTYTLVASLPDGCTSTTTTTVYVTNSPNGISITKIPGYCNGTTSISTILIANLPAGIYASDNDIVWTNANNNFTYTGDTMYTLEPDENTWTVTVTNVCGSATASVFTQRNSMDGDNDRLVAYEVYLTPDLPNTWYVFDYDLLGVSTKGAYNMTDYWLFVFDDEGIINLVDQGHLLNSDGSPNTNYPDGFINPTIHWNGILNNMYVPMDVYKWYLVYRNCSHTVPFPKSGYQKAYNITNVDTQGNEVGDFKMSYGEIHVIR